MAEMLTREEIAEIRQRAVVRDGLMYVELSPRERDALCDAALAEESLRAAQSSEVVEMVAWLTLHAMHAEEAPHISSEELRQAAVLLVEQGRENAELDKLTEEQSSKLFDQNNVIADLRAQLAAAQAEQKAATWELRKVVLAYDAMLVSKQENPARVLELRAHVDSARQFLDQRELLHPATQP